MSFNMFYDSVIYLNNLEIAQWALVVTKNVFIFSKFEKVTSLTNKALENYDEFKIFSSTRKKRFG